ncbi:hypothetical protein L6452_41120 [Arctium lappa]|uniref:Uncharacterized protein n=1 Tax=Arctium lappa TaxID=4217 RepID=A0ACB8XP95_ARCLA|nr:hypothetical protein L6452_41120 [Arctium lappa]
MARSYLLILQGNFCLTNLVDISWTFSQAAIVAFFSSLGELDLYSTLLYYLKAEFHFDKDQVVDLMIIIGIAGIISQACLLNLAYFWITMMVLMPLLAKVMNEEKFLQLGSSLTVNMERLKGALPVLSSFAIIVSPLIFSPLSALFLFDNALFVNLGFSLVRAASFVISSPPDSKLDNDSLSMEP